MSGAGFRFYVPMAETAICGLSRRARNSRSGTALRSPRPHLRDQDRRRALTLPPKGTQRASEPPPPRTAFSIETRSLAIVISRTGRPELAALDQAPGGPHRERAGDRVDARVQARDAGHVEAVARPPGRSSLERRRRPASTQQVRRRRPTAACGRSRASPLPVVARPPWRAVCASKRNVSSVPSSISGVRRRGTPSPSNGAVARPSGSRPSSTSAQAPGDLARPPCRRTASGRAGRRRPTASRR